MNRSGAGASVPFLCCARHCGDVRVFKLLLDRGADRSATDDAGNTALHVASGAGNKVAIRFIVEAGINANVKRKSDEQTPIMAAAKSMTG